MTPRVLLMTSTSAAGFHVAPALGLHRLRHHLREAGFGCDIHDADVEAEAPFLEAVARGDYQVLGFSVSHYNLAQDLDRIWRFRAASEAAPAPAPLFLGGGQEATMNAAQFLAGGLELVLTGFAERSLVRLCRDLVARPAASPEARVAAVPGAVARRADGSLCSSPAPRLDADEFRRLNHDAVLQMELPYAAYWEKVRRESDAFQLGGGKFVVENVRLYTSSHCPRLCGFCSSQAFLPASQGEALPILALSGDELYAVVLDHHRRYGMRGVLFSDDDFLIGTRPGLERARRFCERVTASKAAGELPADLMLNCQARVADFLRGGAARRVDRPLIAQLAAAGFHSVGLGVETFSDRLLQAPTIHKQGIRAADCRAVLEALLEGGLCPQINIILGIPESTVADLVETLEVALGYILRGCQVATTPYILTVPGAPLTRLPGYATVHRTWRHPRTGETLQIADHLEPRDPAIAEAMAHLVEDTDRASAELLSASGWSGVALPKTALGLARFMGLASRVGARALADRLHAAALELLAQAGHGRPAARAVAAREVRP